MQHSNESGNGDGRSISPLDIVLRALRMAQADFLAVAIIFVFLTGPSIWAATHLSEYDSARFAGFIGLASIVPQVLLTERALLRQNLIENADFKRPTFAARAFGLSLISSLAIIAGLLALVIPGMLLLTRWSVSLPALITGNKSISASLQTSWSMTKDRFWFCLASIACAWVPAVIGIAFLAVGYDVLPQLVCDTVFESLLSISILLSWFVAVALYAEIIHAKGDLTA